MFFNRFWKLASSVKGQILVAGQAEYSDSVDIAAFVADAIEGELGLFYADDTDNTLVPGNANIPANRRVYFALKRGGVTYTTTPFIASNASFTKQRIAFSTAVKQVSTVNITSTFATAVIQDITYSAKPASQPGTDITITYVVAGNNTALSVVVAAKDITVNLATDGGGAATSTATLVKAAVDASAPATALVSATITGTAATVQVAQGETPLTGGEVVETGNILELLLIDKTPGYTQFPTYTYRVARKAGETYAALVTRLIAAINDSTYPANRNRDKIVVATASGSNIVLTAVNFGDTFDVILREDLSGSTVTKTTKASYGSGYYEYVKALEAQGDLFAGVTTNYPKNANPEDYGKPPSLVASGIEYNSYMFTDTLKEATLAGGTNAYEKKKTIVVMVPSNGAANAEAEVKLLFAL